jgi:predicted membrane GTPase involved in stress response
MENGKAIPYSIDKLQDRGKFFVNLTMKFMKVK